MLCAVFSLCYVQFFSLCYVEFLACVMCGSGATSSPLKRLGQRPYWLRIVGDRRLA